METAEEVRLNITHGDIDSDGPEADRFTVAGDEVREAGMKFTDSPFIGKSKYVASRTAPVGYSGFTCLTELKNGERIVSRLHVHNDLAFLYPDNSGADGAGVEVVKLSDIGHVYRIVKRSWEEAC